MAKLFTDEVELDIHDSVPDRDADEHD